MYRKIFPKVIAFDLDGTVFNITTEDRKLTYNYFENMTKFIGDLQVLRKYGVKLVVVSRHYFPKHLIHEKILEQFDIIICLYTGYKTDKEYKKYKKFIDDDEDLLVFDKIVYKRSRQKKENNFRNQTTRKKLVFPFDINFADVNKNSHIDILKFFLPNVKDSQIFMFDDDRLYIDNQRIQKDIRVIEASSDDSYQPFDGFSLCLYESLMLGNKEFTMRRQGIETQKV
jgi:hypothetical protein